MHNYKFLYNKNYAFCNFCFRKKNPHPDYDEPLVFTYININLKKLKICINCFHEISEISKMNEDTFEKTLLEKYNLIKLLNKKNIINQI